MPSASNYTNKVRFAASVKNTKVQLIGGIANGTQSSIAGCGLDIQYNAIEYVEVCRLGCRPIPVVCPSGIVNTYDSGGVTGSPAPCSILDGNNATVVYDGGGEC